MTSVCLRAGATTLHIAPDGPLVFTHGTQRWENNGVMVVLHYYDRQHPRAQVVAVPSSDGYTFGTAGTTSHSCRGTLQCAHLADETVDLLLAFAEIHLEITLQIALLPDGSGFTCTIPEGGIREDHPGLYRLLGLELLPEFGAARSGEAGYLLLPNWFGTQCFFDKDYPREVWQTIYSSNDQWEHVCNMPVFGITRAHGTLCGLVTAGDEDAQLVCRQHWQRAEHNSIHPYLVYRWAQEDARIAGTRQVQYAFAPAESADGEGYVFCGKAYRRLLRRRGLQSWAEKGRSRPEALDYAGRFFLKIFMACKTPQADGAGAYQVGCTFDEARRILETCLARGMTRLTVVLVGWGQDGHDGKCPTYLPPDARLGGEEAMRALIDWCRAQDIQLGVHTSHDSGYGCSDELDLDDVIRQRSGEHWQSIVWSGGQSYKLCPSVALHKYVERDLPRLAALGLHGHHHFDAVGSFMPCYAPEHPVPQRADFLALVREQFTLALRVMGSVSTEMPFGPYFPVTDGFLHGYAHPYPWHLASPIGRYFYDRTVPLLAVALHGSCRCGQSMGAGTAALLDMLDMGTVPQSEVAMHACPDFGVPAFADRVDLLAATYQRFYAPDGILAHIGQANIAARRERAPGVTETHYDNGVRLLVNRTANPVGSLAPMSYAFATEEEWAVVDGAV